MKEIRDYKLNNLEIEVIKDALFKMATKSFFRKEGEIYFEVLEKIKICERYNKNTEQTSKKERKKRK